MTSAICGSCVKLRALKMAQKPTRSRMAQTDEYVDRLLQCAKWYRSSRPRAVQMPMTFTSTDDVFTHMRDALLLEAHHAMQNELASSDKLIFNAIDLTTNEPGIVRAIATDANEVTVSRGDDTVVPVKYERAAAASQKVVPMDLLKPAAVSPRVANQIANVSRRAEERALAQAQTKATRELMSPEERRAERKEKQTRAQHQSKCDDAADGKQKPAVQKDAKERTAKAKKQACADDVEATPPIPDDQVRQKRRKADSCTVFDSPASHDRHLVALTACEPHAALRGTLLTGLPAACENLTIVQGPPGTGKTTTLLDHLARLLSMDLRCLVCAPSNVAVVDLYRRAIARGIGGALCVSKPFLPVGTPRRTLVQVNDARVVFATVCGRTGPQLTDQSFDAVLLDEAAHCSEAHCWGLIRPEVAHLVFVGDPLQLPAQHCQEGASLLHNRSMMERLASLGVACTRLTCQRRMHSQIVQFPNTAFYDGALVTGDRAACSAAEGFAPYRVHATHGSERCVHTSFENETEAAEAVRMARELAESGLEVAILVPYQAQVRRCLAFQSNVPVLTIDAAQGKEWDATIVSIVRTQDQGFWSEHRRLTVALTRAKHVQRVLVHHEWEGTSTILGAMVADAAERNCYVAA